VGAAGVLGDVTRGTTGRQRLRRVDRWLLGTRPDLLRRAVEPLVVDLGYGATPVTSVELLTRLRALRADVEVVGVEVDPARVAAAAGWAQPGLSFRQGGFEVPLAGDRRPILVRAMNVLRQYDESAVAGAWAAMASRLAPGGLLVEGTCDELGRRACWVVVGADGRPRELVLSARLADLRHPGELAERLPKALIHRNIAGEGVHDLLESWDRAWAAAAGWSPYGPRVRAVEAARRLLSAGWPLTAGPRRWRLGELALAWDAVNPGYSVRPAALPG